MTASLERVAESFATLGCLVAEARALVAGHDDAPGDLDIDEATVLCLATHEAAFLDGYAAAGGRSDASRIVVLKALALARLVAVSLRIPDRHAATDDILCAAEKEISASAMPN